MSVYLVSAVLLLVYINIFYFYTLSTEDYTIVDIAWGLGFILVAMFCTLVAKQTSISLWVVDALISIWGLRLSIYIYLRHKGKPEDYRYHALRQSWGRLAWAHSYLKVFLLQASIIWIMSTPVMYLSTQNDTDMNVWGVLLASVGLLGIAYESIADYQNYIFKSDEKNTGKFCETGLWRYSRHPNYFGELAFWWALGLLICVTSQSFIGLITPIIINLLIYFVSGVPLLEEKRKDDPAYQAYKMKTNCIIPFL